MFLQVAVNIIHHITTQILHSSRIRQTPKSKAQIFNEQAKSYQKSAHRIDQTLNDLQPKAAPKKLDQKFSRTSTASSNYLQSEAKSRSNRSMSLNTEPDYPIINENNLKDFGPVPLTQGSIPPQHHCNKQAYKFK